MVVVSIEMIRCKVSNIVVWNIISSRLRNIVFQASYITLVSRVISHTPESYRDLFTTITHYKISKAADVKSQIHCFWFLIMT